MARLNLLETCVGFYDVWMASEKVVVLQLEDVGLHPVVHRHSGLLRRYAGLGSLLLRHKRGPAGGFGDLDSCEPGFL